ncbi:hypothetical protein pb186bvf_007515 [Paramecium bursaria]
MRQLILQSYILKYKLPLNMINSFNQFDCKGISLNFIRDQIQ